MPSSPYWPRQERPLPGLPELAYIGRASNRQAAPLISHRHETMEIVYFERGMTEFSIARERHQLRGGEIVIIVPHQEHGGLEEMLQPCSHYYLGLSLEKTKNPFLNLSKEEGAALKKKLLERGSTCFAGPRILPGKWKQIFEILASPRNALTTFSVRAVLMDILVTVMEAADRASPSKHSLMVSEAIRLMEANLEHPLSLPMLCRKLGWSTSHFKDRFRKEMGLPPAEYYLRRRIAKAGHELQESRQSITEIALGLGFPTSQYFATAFKRVTGLTPQRFRAKNTM